VHALVNYSFIESSHRVVNGSAQIAKLLVESIQANGGTVMTRAEAQSFDFADNQISSVMLSNGEVIEGKNFISDIHPASTLAMIPDGYIRKVYRNRILQLENTVSSFSVYIVFKKNSFPYFNYNLYYYKNKEVWDSSIYVPGKPAENFLLLTPAVTTDDHWAESIVIMSYMHYDEVKQWENTRIGKRGADYEAFKKQRSEQLIDLVEERLPGFRNHIHSYYSSSPLTYRDYTGSPQGSLYGVLKDCTDPLKSLISPRTKIPNLLLTGQNIILHGALGVTIAAVTTCSELLGLSYLVGKIKDAS
jgi:all-trans-retinol 13,14-reductase